MEISTSIQRFIYFSPKILIEKLVRVEAMMVSRRSNKRASNGRNYSRSNSKEQKNWNAGIAIQRSVFGKVVNLKRKP